MLMSSLPSPEALFLAKRPPLSRLKLDQRLRVLAAGGCRDLETGRRPCIGAPVAHSTVTDEDDRRPGPHGGCREDRQRDAAADRSRPARAPDLCMAALRRRMRGDGPPPPETAWGFGHAGRAIARNWTEPDFRLDGVFPWLREADRLMREDETTRPAERLSSSSPGHAPAPQRPESTSSTSRRSSIYVLKWNIVDRWGRYNAEAAARRFDELTQAGLGCLRELVFRRRSLMAQEIGGTRTPSGEDTKRSAATARKRKGANGSALPSRGKAADQSQREGHCRDGVVMPSRTTSCRSKSRTRAGRPALRTLVKNEVIYICPGIPNERGDRNGSRPKCCGSAAPPPTPRSTRSTQGVAIGDAVEQSGEMLSVELGPGPARARSTTGCSPRCPRMAAEYGIFLPRGADVAPLWIRPPSGPSFRRSRPALAGRRRRYARHRPGGRSYAQDHGAVRLAGRASRSWIQEGNFTVAKPWRRLRGQGSAGSAPISLAQKWPVRRPSNGNLLKRNLVRAALSRLSP